MPLKYLEEPGPSLGMIRDLPSWLLPPGAVYDCLNLVYDQPGIARQRMGSTALVAGAQTAFATSLGFVRSDDATGIEELYGLDGKAGGLNVINKTSGAATSLGTIGTANYSIGRPVRHFGFLSFPGVPPSGSGSRNIVTVAGQTSSTTFTNTVAASVAAGDPQVTLTGADVTTNVKVGAVVQITDSPQTYHFARVVSIDTTKKFTIWPAPSWTNAAVPIGGVVLRAGYQSLVGGGCGASFQNRLLLGNTNDHGSTGQTLVMDRRVYYSPLPTEFTPVPVPLFAAATLAGASFVEPKFWPLLNYFDVPGADPIVAMEAVSDNQLLIFTTTRPFLLSGDLTTQLATTSPTITTNLSEVAGNGTCISDRGVQRTTEGVVWAGYGGIHAWNGRTPVDLTDKKINTYWRGKVLGSNFVLHGSAYVRGHYIVSYTSGGVTEALACNLANLVWTRLSGVGTDNSYAVARPTQSAQVFALRWWDQTGAAPSMTNGQTIRLDSMFAPFVAGSTTVDADGNAMNMALTTRVLTGDPETQKRFQRGTVRYQLSAPTGNSTQITAQSKIDAADIGSSSVRNIGSLSNTATSTITNATNANPIVITTSANHGLQTDDFVDIDGIVGGGTNATGRYRIAVINATSFSLVGGIGNTAYTSGGQLKKLTESDYFMGTLNAGQGVSFNLTNSGVINDFQVHGFRVAYLERAPVMSA